MSIPQPAPAATPPTSSPATVWFADLEEVRDQEPARFHGATVKEAAVSQASGQMRLTVGSGNSQISVEIPAAEAIDLATWIKATYASPPTTPLTPQALTVRITGAGTLGP